MVRYLLFIKLFAKFQTKLKDTLYFVIRFIMTIVSKKAMFLRKTLKLKL